MGLLDLLSPRACVACGRESDADLCVGCAESMPLVVPPVCGRCGAPARDLGIDLRGAGGNAAPCPACRRLGAVDACRSVALFGPGASPARALVLELKRRGPWRLASAMGRLMAETAEAAGLGAPTVAFVPGGRRRDASGFDHAALLAGAVARALRVRRVDALLRVGRRPRQSDVPAAQRAGNARGAFAARPVTGHVLLVDDVFTTGATVDACAHALKSAGAASVGAVTFARVLKGRR